MKLSHLLLFGASLLSFQTQAMDPNNQIEFEKYAKVIENLIKDDNIKTAKGIREKFRSEKYLKKNYQELKRNPSESTGTFTLTGTIVGISDLKERAANNAKPSTLRILSTYLLFDEDIKEPGIDINLDADYWFVVGTKTVDLSGLDGWDHIKKKAANGKENGANGVDGLPGFPGQNSGHFRGVGKNFYPVKLESLTINVSGGRGGDGQEGGNGADGFNGIKGSIEDVRNRNQSCLISRTPIENNDKAYDQFERTTNSICTVGNERFREVYRSGLETGGAAGKGGKRGAGGKQGTINIEGLKEAGYTKTASPGGPGKLGSSGTPGKDVQHADTFEGIYINEYTPITPKNMAIGGAGVVAAVVTAPLSMPLTVAIGYATVFRFAGSVLFPYASSRWEKKPTKISNGKQPNTPDEVSEVTDLEKIKQAYAIEIEKFRKKAYAFDLNMMPVFKENFLKTIFENLEQSNTNQGINVTGSPLSSRKLKKIKGYMELCESIYTDETTRAFRHNDDQPFSLKTIWNNIISKKKEVKKLFKKLISIQTRNNNIEARSPHHGEKKAKAIPSKSDRSDLREDYNENTQDEYTSCINEINTFLTQEGIKSINESEAISKLSKIQLAINEDYSWYFDSEPKNMDCNTIKALFKDNVGKEHPLSNKAIIAASLLTKAKLLPQNEVPIIDIIDVGFRNLTDLAGIIPSVLRKLVAFKKNSTSWFEEWGEVDYIAYIEKDSAKKETDRLVVVYSGSNSQGDWVSNLTTGHTKFEGVSVHEGIGKLFEKSEDFKKLLDRVAYYYLSHPQPKNFKIVTIGHSLGGALAILAAYYFKMLPQEKIINAIKSDKNTINIDKISIKSYTFGAPAIINKDSKDTVEEALGKNNIYRIWAFYDHVTSISTKIPFQNAVHIGRSFPIHNIENLPLNISDVIRGEHHSAKQYNTYLTALANEALFKNHKNFTSILTDWNACNLRLKYLSQHIEDL